MPRLADFTERHPGVHVALSTRLQPFALEREGVDLAIHYGQADWPEAKMAKLTDTDIVAVCSPSFYAQHFGDEEAPIADAPLIHLSGRVQAWPEWFGNADAAPPIKPSDRVVDHLSMALDAAVASIGVTLAPEFLVKEAIRAAQLTRVSDRSLPTSIQYHVVTPLSAMSPAGAAFKGWLIAASAAERLRAA